ncbi:hypothetical protein HanPI659440_Chr09g0337271 [Helianthus annuus]|nr:hypothetical protein HanPI659440_Chr09g0337271 [Helianthus annuus]
MTNALIGALEKGQCKSEAVLYSGSLDVWDWNLLSGVAGVVMGRTGWIHVLELLI